MTEQNESPSSDQAPLLGGNLPTLLASIKQLPSPPEVCLAVVRAAKCDETTLDDLSRLVESDPALAAKVLRVANSPFFAMSHKTTSVRRATVALGFGTVKTIALGFFLHDQFSKLRLKGLDYPDLATYSLASSAVCETLAATFCPEHRHDAATVGLLHEIGVLVLAMAYGTDYRDIVELHVEDEQPLYLTERKHLGVDHAVAGRLLLAQWKLPDRILTAVESHHELPTAGTDRSEFLLSKIVALGAEAALMYFDTAPEQAARRCLELADRFLGWHRTHLVPIVQQARQDYINRYQFLNRSGGADLEDPNRLKALCESAASEAQQMLDVIDVLRTD